jgi:hypothetical protein
MASDTSIGALVEYAGMLSEAAQRSNAASQLQHRFVNGAIDEVIQTESGPLPSLAKWRADLATIETALADPAKGPGMVAWKRSALTDSIKTIGQMLSAQAHNVWEKADLISSRPTSDPTTWDWAPAILAAWNDTPVGGSLVIPMGVHIGSPVVLPDKAVNLYCMGEITVANGNWTALYFDGTANVVEYPGTILTALTASDTKLNFVPGMEPNFNPTEYYLVIYSNEVNVNRVNEAYYTPYLKRETHALSHYDWSVHDPVLYTYNNLAGVTLRFVKKAQRTKIVGLSLVADATSDRSSRDLLRTCYKSCVDFEGLFINASKANRAGFGFEMVECFDFILNSPRVLGYNLTGVDSYKIRNFLSAHLVFNDYIDATDRDIGGTKTERAYAAMYGNMVLFYNCHLNGIDEHFGSRYIVQGGSLSHRGVGFSGRDFAIDGTRFTGPGVMFQPRDDAPSCSGTLRIDNVELDAVSRLILAETNTAADPLGRSTPFKFFDRVLVDDVRVKGGTQVEDNIISIRGSRNDVKFPVSKTTLFEVKNLKVYSERATIDQNIVQVGNVWIDLVHIKDCEVASSAVAYRGDIRYLAPIYSSLNIGELRLTNCRKMTTYGIRNTTDFNMVGGSLGGSGERLLVSGDHGSVRVSLSGVDLQKPLSESAPVAGVNPSWDIVDCKVRVAPDNLAGRIERGLRNSIEVGVTLPGALVGKLRVYENPSLYIPATILATGSWSVPTIAAGGFVSFDFTVSGVAFGDQVDVSIYPFALLVSPQVTGPDTVKVTLYNGTASAISPGIQGLRFTVRKT